MSMIELPVPWDDYAPITDGRNEAPYRIYSAFRELIDHFYDVRPEYTGLDNVHSTSVLVITKMNFVTPPKVYSPANRMWTLAGYYELSMVCRRNRWAPSLKSGMANISVPPVSIKLYSHPSRVKYHPESIEHHNKFIALFEDYTETDIDSLTNGMFHYI